MGINVEHHKTLYLRDRNMQGGEYPVYGPVQNVQDEDVLLKRVQSSAKVKRNIHGPNPKRTPMQNRLKLKAS